MFFFLACEIKNFYTNLKKRLLTLAVSFYLRLGPIHMIDNEKLEHTPYPESLWGLFYVVWLLSYRVS